MKLKNYGFEKLEVLIVVLPPSPSLSLFISFSYTACFVSRFSALFFIFFNNQNGAVFPNSTKNYRGRTVKDP
ncbi:unnamed protein product [Camellia sinensis]